MREAADVSGLLVQSSLAAPRSVKRRGGRRDESGQRAHGLTRKVRNRENISETKLADMQQRFQHIQISKFNFSGGVSPYPRTQPDKFVRSFLQNAHESGENEHVHEDSAYWANTEDYVTVNAIAESHLQHLSHFDRQRDPRAPRFFRRHGGRLMRKLLPTLRCGSLKDLVKNGCMDNLPLNYGSGAGVRYRYHGYKTKLEAWHNGAREESYRRLSAIMNGEAIDRLPARSAGRAKRTYTSKATDPTASLGRLVWEVDVCDVAIGTLIADPLNKQFKARKDFSGPFIGKSWCNGGAEEIYKGFGYHRNTNLAGRGVDIKRQDASMRDWFWRAFFHEYVAHCFTDGTSERYQHLWDYLTELHSGGGVVLSGGFIAHVLDGAPSGTPFVTMGESCLTYIMCALASAASLSEIHHMTRWFIGEIERRLKRVGFVCSTLGDDSWIVHQRGDVLADVSLDHITKVFSIFGMNISPDKTHEGYGPEEMYYLSYHFCGFGAMHKLYGVQPHLPIRHVYEALHIWCYPETHVHDPDQSYIRCFGHMLSNPDPDLFDTYNTYLKHLERDYDVDPNSMSLASDLPIHDAAFFISQDLLDIKIGRKTYDEIYRLYE